jgi:NADH-quinone oxidoreductase subunit N
VALETMSVSIYVLCGYLKRDQKSNEAALKYLLMGVFSSGVILYGMVMLYGLTGTLDLREVGTALKGLPLTNPALVLGMVMLTAGFGFKIAMVPFHMYIPDVYEGAPTPVTAYIAVAAEAAGFAAMLRVFLLAMPVLQVNWTMLFWVLAALTMTVGNVVAVAQTNIKRMLAYSAIAHVGYMLVGFAAASASGVAMVLFYLVAYVFGNMGAFLVVEAVARAYGIRWLVLEPAHIVVSLAEVYRGAVPLPDWLVQVAEASGSAASPGAGAPVDQALLPAFRLYAVCLDPADPRLACQTTGP